MPWSEEWDSFPHLPFTIHSLSCTELKVALRGLGLTSLAPAKLRVFWAPKANVRTVEYFQSSLGMGEQLPYEHSASSE